MLDEHLRAGGFGAAVPDVVDDRPADVVQQRQAQPPARLVLDDRDRPRPPVQVAEFESTQIRDPQAEPGGHQDHRVVAFAGGGLPVDPGQQPPDLLRGPRVRLGLVTHVPVRRQPVQPTRAASGPWRPGSPGSPPRTTSCPRWSCGAARVDAAGNPTRPARRAPRDPRAHLVEVAQEPAGRLVFRDHGRLGVAARAAPGDVVVPQRRNRAGQPSLTGITAGQRRSRGPPARRPSTPPPGEPPGHPCPGPAPATTPTWSRSGRR